MPTTVLLKEEEGQKKPLSPIQNYSYQVTC